MSETKQAKNKDEAEKDHKTKRDLKTTEPKTKDKFLMTKIKENDELPEPAKTILLFFSIF